MPKTLVLFSSHLGSAASIVDAVADGARAVRFSEVTVRRLNDRAPEEDARAARHPALAHIDELAAYDGIIFIVATSDAANAEVTEFFMRARSLAVGNAFANIVGSACAIGGAAGEHAAQSAWPLLQRMGELEMILIPPSPAATDAAAATEQGRRVAEVVSWVTHARSHAHGDAHVPAHTHPHSHGH